MSDDGLPALTPADEAVLSGSAAPEPAPAPEPSPAADPAPAAEPAAKPAATHMVPAARLKEEADKRRDWERRYQQDIGRVSERVEALQKLLDRKDEPPPPVANVETDPIGALKQTQQQLVEFNAWKAQQEAAQRQHTERLTQETALRSAVAAQETQFRAETPDYDAAVGFVVQQRGKELSRLGLDPVAIQNALAHEAVQIAATALQRGLNPAEVIYGIAQDRGYARKAEAAAAPVATAPAVDPAQQLRTVARGTDAARSTNTAGAPGDRNLTLDRLLKMDDSEFAKMSENEFRKIMGG